MHAVGGWESAEKPGRWALVATCVVAAGFCLSLYLRHNDFPAAYHPDEANKGRAVVFNEWRFRQPLLLISTTWLTARLTGSDGSVQEAVVVGRWVSAFFATGAVVLLVLAAHRAGGASAAVLVAVAVPACPRLLVAAHYMKEDTALLLASRPSRRRRRGCGWRPAAGRSRAWAPHAGWRRPGNSWAR